MGFKSPPRYKEHRRDLLLYLLITVLMSKCIALSFLLPHVKSRDNSSVRSEMPQGFAPTEDLGGGAGYLWRHPVSFL